MPFVLFILIRLLFIASMVFIIGYVFGSFSKNKTLTAITKVASILAIVLFISANVFFARAGGWHHGNFRQGNNCLKTPADSTATRNF